MKHVQRFLHDIDGASPEDLPRIQLQLLVFIAEQIGRIADAVEIAGVKL